MRNIINTIKSHIDSLRLRKATSDMMRALNKSITKSERYQRRKIVKDFIVSYTYNLLLNKAISNVMAKIERYQRNS